MIANYKLYATATKLFKLYISYLIAVMISGTMLTINMSGRLCRL